MALTTIDSVGGAAARSITERLTAKRADVRGKAIEVLLIVSLAISLAILVVLIVDILQRSWTVWTDRPGDFLQNGLNTSSTAQAGVWSAIKGTITLAVLVALLAFPLGIACAVYLEEYAGRSRFARWTRVNVRNLAGVPSIVYGLLGLGIFVKALNGLGDPGERLQGNGFVLVRWVGNVFTFLSGNNGRNIFAGGLALSALVLPIVIITASEALRAVPRSIREGALGVGATQWETMRHHVIPAAAPGILTGTVLSLARATGEAAPLLLVGATTGTLLTGNKDFFEQLSGGFTALPVAIFSYARQTGDDWRAVTGAAALVLLVLVLVMNGFAGSRCGIAMNESGDPMNSTSETVAAAPAAPVVSLPAAEEQKAPRADVPVVFKTTDLAVYYGDFRAVREVDLDIHQHEITAFIGPSGCGKSTVLRCFDRMNDLIEEARVEGLVSYHGLDLYGPDVDPVEVRRRIGMVFQKPNPFPKSIYDNLAFGPRLNGVKKKSQLDDIVERSLRRSALWDEVKDRLNASAMGLSGGQQQRLCIARCVAVEPEVILMDEPCSALDPIATARIEELMQEIKNDYTIVIVTHNMQQAARVSDRTAFFTTEVNPESDRRTGRLVEYAATTKIFSNPDDERTEMYVTGRFG